MARKPSKASKGESSEPRVTGVKASRRKLPEKLGAPGVFSHAWKTFEMIFRNLNLFFPLFAVGVVYLALTIDISHITSVVFGLANFLLMWLATIFILRHLLAGEEISFRDALYNSTTSIVPTLVVLFVVALECVPVLLVVVLLDTAIETNLFAMFGPAVLFWTFALAMLLLTLYWLASTLMALAAASVPGLYPLVAISKANELVKGKRGGIIVRLLVLLIILVAFEAIVMAPVYLQPELPPVIITSLAGVAVSFTTIYAAAYIYTYYKYLLGARNDKR